MITATEQRKYELMVIISGDIPESDAAKEFDEIRKLLKESTGGISFEDVWGKRDFPYRLKKQSRGYYAVFHFTAHPQALSELRTAVKLNPAVLRHMLIIVPENFTPVRYEKEVIDEKRVPEFKPRRKMPFSTPKHPALSSVPLAAAPAVETGTVALPTEPARVAGKEDEDKLKKVEKKLEEILENPDIDIK